MHGNEHDLEQNINKIFIPAKVMIVIGGQIDDTYAKKTCKHAHRETVNILFI